MPVGDKMQGDGTVGDERVRGRPTRGRATVTWMVAVAVSAAMLVVILPRIASYADAAAVLGSVPVLGVGLVGGLSLVSMVVFWKVLAVSIPGLSMRRAAVAKQAPTAAAVVLPAGGAVALGLTYAILTSWRVAVAVVTRSVLVTGVWNNLVKFALPGVAVLLLAVGDFEITPRQRQAAVAGVAAWMLLAVALGLLLASPRWARLLGRGAGAVVDSVRRLARRQRFGGWAERGLSFRADTLDLLDRRWRGLTFWVVASHLSVFAVLLLSIAVVGGPLGQVGVIEVFVVFAFMQAATTVPVTPGSIGVAEVGYTSGLTLLSGGLGPEALAAVLLFRAGTWALPALAGIAALVAWAHSQRHAQRTDTEGPHRLVPDAIDGP